MEEYYHKFIELQERLRKSEEERLQLEMKFNEMIQITNEEEQLYYKRLKSQYKCFVEENRKRQERNEKILRSLERIESCAAVMEAKSKRLRMLRHQYQTFLQRKEREQHIWQQQASNAKENRHVIDPPRAVELRNLQSGTDGGLDSASLLSRIKQHANSEDNIAEEIIRSIYDRKGRRKDERDMTMKIPTRMVQFHNGTDDDDVSTTESIQPVENDEIQKQIIADKVVTPSLEGHQQTEKFDGSRENLDLNQNTRECANNEKELDEQASLNIGEDVNIPSDSSLDNNNDVAIPKEEDIEEVSSLIVEEHLKSDENQEQIINDGENKTISDCNEKAGVTEKIATNEENELINNTNGFEEYQIEEQQKQENDSKIENQNSLENLDYPQEYFSNTNLEENKPMENESILQNIVPENPEINMEAAAYYEGEMASTEMPYPAQNIESYETMAANDQMYYQTDNYDQMQYDENGQPVYQQDYNDPNYQQYQGYDENGQLITYQQPLEMEGGQVGENLEDLANYSNNEDYNLQESAANVQMNEEKESLHNSETINETIATGDVTEQDSKPESNYIQEDLPPANVMELLDTDHESESNAQLSDVRNDAEVVGNESDFNFSSTSDSQPVKNDKN